MALIFTVEIWAHEDYKSAVQAAQINVECWISIWVIDYVGYNCLHLIQSWCGPCAPCLLMQLLARQRGCVPNLYTKNRRSLHWVNGLRLGQTLYSETDIDETNM